MRLEIEVDGTMHEVTIETSGDDGRFLVSWNGTAHEIDARVIERDAHGVWLSLIRSADAESQHVRCSTLTRTGEMTVRTAGVDYGVVVNGRRTRVGGDGGAAGATGAARLTAPMPGKVVRVLVAPGDVVEPRQPVIVVEAMKMENELTAASGGTVTEVAVAEGDSVDAGRLLAVIE